MNTQNCSEVFDTRQEMGGAEGKVAWIGESSQLLSTRSPAEDIQTLRAHSVPKELYRLLNASEVSSEASP